MKRVRLGLLAGLSSLAAMGGIAAVADSHTVAKAAAASVTIKTRTLPGLGKVLISSSGRTLYMFAPDKDRKVTCTSAVCVNAWPPLFVKGGAKIKAGAGVKQGLLGSDKDSAGGRVVTYKGWPLYYFKGDTKNGVAYGQDIDLTGGYWYVMSPTGAIIKHKATTTTTTTTTTSSTTTTGGTTTTSSSACSDEDNDGDQAAGGPDDGDGCL